MKSRIILDPWTVARCLQQTTEAEDDELRKIWDAAPNEVEAVARTCEWLLKRFPQLDVSIRRSAAAGTN